MNWPWWLWVLVVGAYFALAWLLSWVIGSSARRSRDEPRGDVRNKIRVEVGGDR